MTYSLLLCIRLGLWLKPAKSVAFFGHHKRPPWAPFKGIYPVSTLVWAVERSASLPLGHMKCLGRALVTQTLMVLSGYPSTLCFGVKKEQDHQLEAHAWVDYQGHIIIGELSNMSHFYPLSTWVTSKQ